MSTSLTQAAQTSTSVKQSLHAREVLSVVVAAPQVSAPAARCLNSMRWGRPVSYPMLPASLASKSMTLATDRCTVRLQRPVKLPKHGPLTSCLSLDQKPHLVMQILRLQALLQDRRPWPMTIATFEVGAARSLPASAVSTEIRWRHCNHFDRLGVDAA